MVPGWNSSRTHRRRRIGLTEILETRIVPAILSPASWPTWESPTGGAGGGWNQPWQAGQRLNLSVDQNVVNILTFTPVPEKVEFLTQWDSDVQILPAGPAERVGDPVDVVMSASIQASSQTYPGRPDLTMFQEKTLFAQAAFNGTTLFSDQKSGFYDSFTDSKQETQHYKIGDTFHVSWLMDGYVVMDPALLGTTGGYWLFAYDRLKGTINASLSVISKLDLAAPDMKSSSGSPLPTGTKDFYWNSLEDGGGFTFSYDVGGQDPDGGKIEFRWATGPDQSEVYANELALSLDLNENTGDLPDGVSIVSGPIDLAASGHHTLRVLHSALNEDHRTPVVDGDSEVKLTHLLMIIDPDDDIDEAHEDNNVAALKVVPLVVNVVTHGFQPNPFDSTSLDDFQGIADDLDKVPEHDSILEGRVDSLVPNWILNSTITFGPGFLALFGSKIAEAKATLEASSVWHATSVLLEKAARLTSIPSDNLLELSVNNAIGKLYDPSNDLLLATSPDVPPLIQHVNLVGHSRGAMFNAELAYKLLLRNSGLTFSDFDYTSLDGYAGDWSNSEGTNFNNGVLTNFNSPTNFISLLTGYKQNYRVQQGLEIDPAVLKGAGYLPEDVLNQLWATNDIRSPDRNLGGNPDPILPGTTHTTITAAYADLVFKALFDSDQTEFGGFLWDNRDSMDASSQSALSTQSDAVTLLDSFPVVTGFNDGPMEELGEFWTSILAAGGSPTGISFIDEQLQYWQDPLNVISLFWEATGDVSLLQTSTNTALKLKQSASAATSIDQLVTVSADQTTLDFDLGILAPNAGATLDILLDDQVIQSIALTATSAGTKSIPLLTGTEGLHKFQFRLNSGAGNTGVISLDNIAFGPQATNAAPTVAGLPVVSLSYQENQSPLLIAPNLTLSDSDTPILAAGRLSVQILAGSDPGDQVQIIPGGSGQSQATVVNDTVQVGGVEIGTWNGGVGSVPLVIQLNSAATLTRVQSLLRRVSFVNTGNAPATTPRTVSFRAWDGEGGISTPSALTVSVASLNDAPVLDPAGSPTLPTIAEDVAAANNPGTLVSTLIANMAPGSISDPDSSTALQGIAVTSVDQSHGTWQFSLDSGTDWTDFGTPSVSAARLLASDSKTKIRFLPNPNFSGTATFVFVAWDLTEGANGETAVATSRGGTKAFSLAAETASINVTAVNDPPVLKPNGDPILTAIVEDPTTNPGTLISTLITSMAPKGSITDADTNAKQGLAIIGANQLSGTWQFTTDGTTWKDFGTTSVTNALLLASDAKTKIRFVPRHNFNGSAGITFLAWDQTVGTNGQSAPVANSTAFSSAKDNAFITVTPVNDAPVLNPAGTPRLNSIPEDVTPDVNQWTRAKDLIGRMAPDGGISDVDTNAQRGLAITGANQLSGKWQFSTDNGKNWNDFGSVSITHTLLLSDNPSNLLRFLPIHNFNGQSGLTFTAWDQTTGSNGSFTTVTALGGTTAFSSQSETAFITITPVNDAPVLNPAGNPTLTSITKNLSLTSNTGTLLSQIIASMSPQGGITDADANAKQGLAVIGANQLSGTWQYSTNGTTWVNFGSVSGSNALLLAANATTRIRFVPNSGFSGQSGVTFLGWDQSDNIANGSYKAISAQGGNSSMSSEKETAIITVT